MLLLVGAILAASIVVALGAARTGLPVLVAFLALGMLLGSDGPGGIEFDDAELAREVGIIGLALILYEGGLQTSWRRLRQVAVPAALLSTVGVVVSAVLGGAAARALFDLTWLQAILLGAVVASTDAAAVFATLRFTHIRRRLARTLEAESGGNDPMAIALTLGLIAWIEEPDTYGFDDLLLLVVQQLGLGLLVGIALGVARVVGLRPAAALDRSVRAGRVGRRGGALVRRRRRDRRQRLPRRLPRRARGRQHALPLPPPARRVPRGPRLPRPGGAVRRPRPARLPEVSSPEVALPGLALAALLMLVVRPAAVWASTAFSDFDNRERLLLGWAGLRGAVPIVLATFALSSDVAEANTIFNAVFFVVVVSTIVQGTTLERVAGKLRLSGPARERSTSRRSRWGRSASST